MRYDETFAPQLLSPFAGIEYDEPLKLTIVAMTIPSKD
jgi:hypothetical protein